MTPGQRGATVQAALSVARQLNCSDLMREVAVWADSTSPECSVQRAVAVVALRHSRAVSHGVSVVGGERDMVPGVADVTRPPVFPATEVTRPSSLPRTSRC